MAKSPSFTFAAGMFGLAGLAKLAAFAAALAILGSTTGQAGSLGKPCTSAPQSQWLSLDSLQSKLEAVGYKIQKSKLKNACGEMYATDKNGARVELFVDPTNGDIVGRL